MTDLIDDATVIVCCGSGGVGKTTTAAVLGIEAARRGRRAVVVTIDPARRLADALGLVDGLAAEPQRIDLDGGVEPVDGELWAMMLDPAATFDRLVRTHARDDAQIDTIVTNAFYRNVARSLSGTQEYMAAETLHALHGDERFDLVVVDTPPSRNALDFLEAPGVLSRFLDHALFRLLMLPTRSSLRVIGAATQPVFRAIGKVVGSEALADSVAFFQAFTGMEDGFRERAREVDALIRAAATSFVVVASPRVDTVAEAVWFARQLVDQGVGITAAVVNRAQPQFGMGLSGDADEHAVAARAAGDGALGALWENVGDLRRQREAEMATLAPLAEIVGVDQIAVLPLLDSDVHDLDGLWEIVAHLFDHPHPDLVVG